MTGVTPPRASNVVTSNATAQLPVGQGSVLTPDDERLVRCSLMELKDGIIQEPNSMRCVPDSHFILSRPHPGSFMYPNPEEGRPVRPL